MRVTKISKPVRYAGLVLVIILFITGIIGLRERTNEREAKRVRRILTPASLPGDNWSNFRSNEVGFELKYPLNWVINKGGLDPSRYPVDLNVNSKDWECSYEYMGGDWPALVCNKGGRFSLSVDTNSYYKSWSHIKAAENKDYLYPYEVKLTSGDTALFRERLYKGIHGVSEVIFIKERIDGGGVFVFKASMTYAENEKEKYMELFKEILATLEFDKVVSE